MSKRDEFAQHIAEARDGMAQQNRESVVAQIERDQSWRDPRRQHQREPALRLQHLQEKCLADIE